VSNPFSSGRLVVQNFSRKSSLFEWFTVSEVSKVGVDWKPFTVLECYFTFNSVCVFKPGYILLINIHP
jgi:hypothetical protein